MNKIGNLHSALLDALTKTAAKKDQPAFDINEILRKQPKPPTLQELFAEAVRNSGKNVKRTAQFDSMPGDELGGAPGGELGDMPGDEGPPPPMDSAPEDEGIPGEEDENSGVKQHLVDALIELCGSAEEASQCILDQAGPEEDLGGDLVGELGEDLPGDDLSGEDMLGDEMPGMAEEMQPVDKPMLI